MRIAWVERLLSLGHSDAIPHRVARHVRVTNALALIGVCLACIGVPLDMFAQSVSIVTMDVVSGLLFASVWQFTARGHLLAARIMLMVAANSVLVVSTYQLGGVPELRTVFFPLVIMSFLVFNVRERFWLATFIALPVIWYFALAYVPEQDPNDIVVIVNRLYAPILSFMMIIGGTYAVALIDDRAQTKLVHAQARAAQSARLVALGEMSSGIAHEVRNPLAAIHMAATQIAEHPEDRAQVAQLGERIQRIVMRASRTIEAMRAFSRDAGSDPFVSTPVERVIADALELCGKHLAERAVELKVATVSPELTVECRAVQLTQVLVNLINNAYDAVSAAPERWVRIDVTVVGEQVEIAVTDSGGGIPPLVRERLFEPFFTTKPADRGTGLGLSLSREIAEAHSGTLVLDEKSPNTRFVITVPRCQPVVRAPAV